jgi:demethylmenaquinone methyltransferase/2-methoxy-6-polyprenyl-1,4-benzoquinol methylase
MKGVRRAYYDIFSGFYDGFVALHSRDLQGAARTLLVDRVPVEKGGSVLDLCTGTGTLLPRLQAKVGPSGQVVGVDFSSGMLKMAGKKTQGLPNVALVKADAGSLPFASGIFDAVTCSHAFYELKGETQRRALREIARVLKPEGAFLMMEHDVPANLFVRILFYLRLTCIGAGWAMSFLRHEREVLEGCFGSVEKVVAPAGRSKIMICRESRPRS